jgi:hypothetical protein
MQKAKTDDRSDSLFGYRNITPLKTAAKKHSLDALQQQKYMSERKRQSNPWTAFNHKDDPVHICVCVCVRARGLEMGICDTVC